MKVACVPNRTSHNLLQCTMERMDLACLGESNRPHSTTCRIEIKKNLPHIRQRGFYGDRYRIYRSDNLEVRTVTEWDASAERIGVVFCLGGGRQDWKGSLSIYRESEWHTPGDIQHIDPWTAIQLRATMSKFPSVSHP